jgi:hypothetical protein
MGEVPEFRLRAVTLVPNVRIMVSTTHESAHKIFRADPELTVRALRLFGIELPSQSKVTELDTALGEISAIDRRVDTLLRVDTDEGSFVLVVEAQGKKAEGKHEDWAYYLAHVLAKYRLPPLLLVVCDRRSTARWAAAPNDPSFAGFSSLAVRPLVLGPDNVPKLMEPEEAAENLAFASFAARTHRHDPLIGAILGALAVALARHKSEDALTYAEFTEAGLQGSRAYDIWRTLVQTMQPDEYVGMAAAMIREDAERKGLEKGLEEGLEKGVPQGEARALLLVLDRRGVDLSAEERERISSCGDQAQLESWIERALVVTTSGELFA